MANVGTCQGEIKSFRSQKKDFLKGKDNIGIKRFKVEKNEQML